MTKPRTGPKPPQRPPWESAQSKLAGLPKLDPKRRADPDAVAEVRAAWLDIVLPAILSTETHPKTAERLAAKGYTIQNDRPGSTVAAWYAWLARELRRRRLPELADRGAAALPKRLPGRRDAPPRAGHRFAPATPPASPPPSGDAPRPQ